MKPPFTPHPRCPRRTAFVALALVAVVLPAQAQFKLIEPDGRVTYTDRPPSPSTRAQVKQLQRDGSVAPAAEVQLPLELRQAATRFPVTLYTADDCAPCESARRLLQSRGVPHAEKLVNDEASTEALMRLSGGRAVPTLTVGAQVLRGYAGGDWTSTLDAAGYPHESKLPRGYVAPAPTPLVAKTAAPPPAPVEPPAAPAQPAVEASGPGPSIRF